LKDIICSIIKEEIQQVSTLKKKETIYLTRKEAATFLKISLPTLWSYTNIGVIKGFKIGSRVLYKLEDLEGNLNAIATSKYAHGKWR
jgi:hypothetical protein